MLIYCAKCEAQNSDQAPVCGECGNPLMSLAQRAPMPEDRSPKKPDRTTKLGGLIDKVANVVDDDDPTPARSLITIRGKPIWAAITLLAGALGGVALYLGSPSERVHLRDKQPPYTRGLGWSAARIKAVWGSQQGWVWYHNKPALSGEPGVVDLRARRSNGAQLQVVGQPNDVRLFTITQSIRLDGLEIDFNVKIAQWTRDLAAPIALVADIEPGSMSEWVHTAFWEYSRTLADEPHGDGESIESGEFKIQIGFFVTKDPSGFTALIGVSRRND